MSVNATLLNNTKQAAGAALDGGLIDKAQYARMTDGTVTQNDVAIASKKVQDLIASGAPDGQMTIAKDLLDSIKQQLGAQQQTFGGQAATVFQTITGR